MLVSLLPLTAGFTFTQRRAHAQCGSNDLRIGGFSTLQRCAEACAATRSCRFFTFAPHSHANGDCYQEYTLQATCPEGWDYTDRNYSFYELNASWMGCTEPRAANFRSEATVDDGSCQEADPCVTREVDGSCATCIGRHGCDVGNHGYRNPNYDKVYAQYLGPHLKRSAGRKGHGHAKVIDGDLDDWLGHDPSLVYRDVAFAKPNGEEVIFESSAGGKWFGDSDFSAKWMVAYNDAWLYLAFDVSDDKTFVGSLKSQADASGADACWSYRTGLQLGFEVHAGVHAPHNTLPWCP